MANRANPASRSRPRSSTRAAALVALLFAARAEAGAVTPDRCQVDRGCRELTEQAAQLAGQTRYDEALSRYELAYERVPEPRLLVNIGRCHYRLGRARKALEYFENFQKAELDVEAELTARVGQFVAEAKLAILSDTAKPEEKSPANEPDRTPEPKPVPLATSNPMPDLKTTAAVETPRQARPIWRIAVGAAALGVGGVLMGLGGGALSADGKCQTPDPTSPELCTAALNSEGVRTTMLIDGKPTGLGLLVSGGLIAVGGAVLIALPGPRRKNLALRRTFDANALQPGTSFVRTPFELPAAAVERGALR